MNLDRGLLAAAAGALLVLGVASPASAAPSDVVDGGTPGLLWLEIDATADHVDLDPGESGYRLITLHLDTEPSSALAVQVSSSGSLATDANGLRIGIDECSTAWAAPAGPGDPPDCPGTVTSPLSPVAFSALSATSWQALGTLVEGTPRYLRITLTLPDPLPVALRGGTAGYQISFAAAGDVVPVDGPPTGTPQGLPWTGAAIAVPLALAVLLGGAGALLRASDRRRAG